MTLTDPQLCGYFLSSLSEPYFAAVDMFKLMPVTNLVSYEQVLTAFLSKEAEIKRKGVKAARSASSIALTSLPSTLMQGAAAPRPERRSETQASTHMHTLRHARPRSQRLLGTAPRAAREWQAHAGGATQQTTGWWKWLCCGPPPDLYVVATDLTTNCASHERSCTARGRKGSCQPDGNTPGPNTVRYDRSHKGPRCTLIQNPASGTSTPALAITYAVNVQQ